MNQKCLGAKLGTDESSVWNWENDRNKPEIRFLPAILSFLGYDPRPKPASLPEQLVFYREGKGWSQAHFARVLGFDPTTLARWERGEKQPIGEYQKRVALFLCDG